MSPLVVDIDFVIPSPLFCSVDLVSQVCFYFMVSPPLFVPQYGDIAIETRGTVNVLAGNTGGQVAMINGVSPGGSGDWQFVTPPGLESGGTIASLYPAGQAPGDTASDYAQDYPNAAAGTNIAGNISPTTDATQLAGGNLPGPVSQMGIGGDSGKGGGMLGMFAGLASKIPGGSAVLGLLQSVPGLSGAVNGLLGGGGGSPIGALGAGAGLAGGNAGGLNPSTSATGASGDTATGAPVYLTDPNVVALKAGQAVQEGAVKGSQEIQSGLGATSQAISGASAQAGGITQYLGNLAYNTLPRVGLIVMGIVLIGGAFVIMGLEQAKKAT